MSVAVRSQLQLITSMNDILAVHERNPLQDVPQDTLCPRPWLFRISERDTEDEAIQFGGSEVRLIKNERIDVRHRVD